MRHERSHAPGLLARGLRAPQVQGIEMAVAAVAEQAVEIAQRQEIGGDIGGFLIPVVSAARRISGYDAADDVVELALRVAVGSGGADDLASHLIVGFSGSQRIADEFVEGHHAILEAASALRVGGIILEEVRSE